jgi:hypothetical protein
MDNMITWNVRNWITVVLMFLLAWFILMAGVRLFVKKAGLASFGNYMPLQAQNGQAGT